MEQDQQLVARVLTGDPAAERALYEAHAERAFRLAFRLTGDADLAEDCVQETFVRAFDRLRDWRGDSALAAWLHSVATSVTLNALRRQRRHRVGRVELTAVAEFSGPVREPQPDLRERMRRAIEALPDRYRTVFLLHDVEGYKHEEIGVLVGAPAGTSKARLSRARALLRDALADFAL